MLRGLASRQVRVVLNMAENAGEMITDERPATSRDDSNATLLSEFPFGTWSRSFRFPHSLDRDQLKASYRDGILDIKAGKAVEHTCFSVTVES